MRKLTTIVLLVAALGMIWVAGTRHSALVEMRGDYGLDQAEPLENSPPLVAFTTVALGGFRGLLVDALWMRLSRLQSEGRYFELVQLADWITKLEPRSAAIWTFQAWNLSYNISVLMTDPEDRWRWVYHGVKLLRDEGLFYNRGSARLYKELGWLYQHKIGSGSDHAHWYYKREWYRMMDDLLGGPRPDYKDLLSGNPEMAATLNEMRRRYKLDPERMRALEAEYGPLDWRIPETHAVYWAYSGIPYARRDFDRDGLSRMIFQSLVALFQHGDYRFEDGHLVDLPDLDIFPYVDKAFQNAYAGGSSNPTFDEAYYNFLLDAMILNVYFQRDDEARAVFERLRESGSEKLEGESFESLLSAISRQPIESMRRHRALALIYSMLLQRARLRAAGDGSAAEQMETTARENWHRFQATRSNPNFKARTGLPPFEVLKALAARRAENSSTAEGTLHSM